MTGTRNQHLSLATVRNPFNDSLIASGADDGKVFLWRVPEGFTLHPNRNPDDIEDIGPVGKLSGHPRKVGHVLFNPAAENVLATASGDFTVKIWDIEAGNDKLTLKLGDVVQSQSWSVNGSMLVTTSRDKRLRIWDVRQERPVQETAGHSGAKNSRAVWLGEHDRIATTGFSKMSDRQLALWDIRAPREPISGFKSLDSISGVCMPFWDEGTQCLYLAGKGDGNIRYFELENDKFEYLSEYKSSDPQRGVAFMPKRGVNMHQNEVVRIFKSVSDTYIEPISFIVPRRSEVFQDDIYPPTIGLTPAMGPTEWFAGKEAVPPKISMASLYEGTGIQEVTPSQDKPSSVSSAPPPKIILETITLAEPVREPVPQPSPTARDPPPSITEQGASVASMISKFADEDDPTGESDVSSSFEEVSRPIEQSSESTSSIALPAGSAPQGLNSIVSEADSQADDIPQQSGVITPALNSSSTSIVPTNVVQRDIQEIKSLIAEQTKTIASQAQQVQNLTAEIESLKAKLG
jgi:coronin-1B/1C/6